MQNLEVDFCGLRLENSLMNAAGTCKLKDGPEGVEGLLRTEAAAIMVGSGTIYSRSGNAGTAYWFGGSYAVNSLGLPNPGSDWYSRNLAQMVTMAHDAGKKLFFSAAGFSPAEYLELSLVALSQGADAVELNFGCPNVWGPDGAQKRIASFDVGLVGETLELVGAAVGPTARIFCKMSPLSDPSLIEQLASAVSGHQCVKAITAVNTFPNGYALDEAGKTRITPAGGLGGVSGPAMKPIGLGQVLQWRQKLPSHIAVIGVGGISTGQDMLDYQGAGAQVMQVATAYLERKGGVFAEILAEYVSLKT